MKMRRSILMTKQLTPDDLLEMGCFCGGKFEKIGEHEWRCNRCGFGIVERGFWLEGGDER